MFMLELLLNKIAGINSRPGTHLEKVRGIIRQGGFPVNTLALTMLVQNSLR